MRDKTHSEQIERWAKYVKENPENWKSKFNEFINSQIEISRRFYKELAKTDKGKEKIKKIKSLKN